MDELLKLVDMNHQLACDTETGGCGRLNHIHHLLHAAPCVFTTGKQTAVQATHVMNGMWVLFIYCEDLFKVNVSNQIFWEVHEDLLSYSFLVLLWLLLCDVMSHSNMFPW